MKRLLKPLFLVLILTAFFRPASRAQSLSGNQIGLRLGGYSGIDFRHINSDNVGVHLDLLESWSGYWTMFSAMAEKHFPLQDHLVVFIGGGAFLGGWHDHYYERGIDPYWDARFGVQGVVGLDYYFQEVPLNIGLDFTPRFSFIAAPFPADIALSVRYLF